MKRRDFIAGLGAAAVPVGVRAQRAAVPVIGWLGSQSRQAAGAREFLVAFRRGLSETGYVEGRNVAFEYRWAESHNDRLPALAAELVRRGVTVIVAPSTLGACRQGCNANNPYRFRDRRRSRRNRACRES